MSHFNAPWAPVSWGKKREEFALASLIGLAKLKQFIASALRCSAAGVSRALRVASGINQSGPMVCAFLSENLA